MSLKISCQKTILENLLNYQRAQTTLKKITLYFYNFGADFDYQTEKKLTVVGVFGSYRASVTSYEITLQLHLRKTSFVRKQVRLRFQMRKVEAQNINKNLTI